jgi:protein SYS1
MLFPRAWEHNVQDAWMILGQIGALVSLFYLTLVGVFFLFDTLFTFPMTVSQFFSYRLYSFENSLGRWTCVSWLLNECLGALVLLWVVRRAKKCLDFSSTLHVLHFVVCLFYDGLPLRWEWWIVMITGFLVMTIGGEYAAYRVEMREFRLYRPVDSEDEIPSALDDSTTPHDVEDHGSLSLMSSSSSSGVTGVTTMTGADKCILPHTQSAVPLMSPQVVLSGPLSRRTCSSDDLASP